MTRQQILLAIAALLISLAFGAAGLRWAGDKTDTGAAISPPPSSSDTPFAQGPERDSFIASSVSSCAKEVAAKEPLGRPLSDREIDTYCRCYSNGMADVITGDDVKRMSAGAPPMDVVHDKAVRVLQSCHEQLRTR